MIKLNYVKASTLFTAITIALLISCSEEEKVTPRSSTSSMEGEKETIIENYDYISEDNNNGGRITQNIKVRYITGYFARLSNATTGSVKLIIVKESTNTIVATSASKAVSALGIWSGNTNDVDYTVCTFGWTNGLSLDPNESYRIEAHCTDCSTDADKKVVWWSTNNYASSSQDTYTLGTGKATADGVSWVSKKNDFSFKIQNVNSDGSFYVSRAQSVKQKVYEINTSVIRAQSFKPEVGDDYIISFSDADLASAVRNASGLTEDASITYGHVKNITDLNRNWISVSNLEGIEYLENLQTLSIKIDNQTNLDILRKVADLDKLTRLVVSATQVTDISFLGELSNLNDLYFYSDELVNIAPLENLTNLRQLQLGCNKVSDISKLAGLKKLEKLFLRCTSGRINNITPLLELSSLTLLSIWGTQIADLSPLSDMIDLIILDLNGNNLTRIPSLNNLSQLELLLLEDNQIRLLDNFAASLPTTLVHLSLIGNPLTAQQVNALRLQLPNTTIVF